MKKLPIVMVHIHSCSTSPQWTFGVCLYVTATYLTLVLMPPSGRSLPVCDGHLLDPGPGFQWTYQAMVHELLTLNNNRVSLAAASVRDDCRDLVLASHQDDFYAKVYPLKIKGKGASADRPLYRLMYTPALTLQFDGFCTTKSVSPIKKRTLKHISKNELLLHRHRHRYTIF